MTFEEAARKYQGDDDALGVWLFEHLDGEASRLVFVDDDGESLELDGSAFCPRDGFLYGEDVAYDVRLRYDLPSADDDDDDDDEDEE